MPFILGRPLGKPNDAQFQRRVLRSALQLLTRTDDTISEWFEEDIEEVTTEDEPWSCPVSFSGATEQSPREALLAEISLLKPWFERGQIERGRTSFGVSNQSPEEIADFISAIADNDISDDADLGDRLKYAAEDLKAFYNEAATSQPGQSTAAGLENWYWQETFAGRLVKAAQAAGANSKNAGLKLTAKFLLVPGSQS